MKVPMRLGALIDRLDLCKPDAEVRYDFASFVPVTAASYRGDYSQLAISHEPYKKITVAALLEVLRDANGKTFCGWKGGDYTMHDGTPVWVANSGECDSTGIIGVLDKDYMVILETRYLDL